MRFLKDGPAIPGDLLIARDEGRVVFFCGAGVSRAYAGLPDFFGLANSVIGKLGVPKDNPACKILDEACEIGKRTGVSGLISADRIFGLLERDFFVRDIEAAVAEALRPANDVDLTAHQTLLHLATTPEGKVRLVTTNFDRLFEDCCDELTSWQPPRLPDPSRHDEMDGIIHLHGCVAKDYNGAEGDGFILSSSAFGRAYLSDGWATRFFREILDRYVVVFVGYTADDPPVQYLLEALNKRPSRIDNVYAFQSGLASEAGKKWLHKGVEAIPYAENEGHRVLWASLSAWTERAKAPADWYNSVINLARNGPEKLELHERGRVAHIISTVEGARKFSEGEKPPPAEWLCVFDPVRRYAVPGRKFKFEEQGPFIDPFLLYGIDRDTPPQEIDPDSCLEKREIPLNAWDGLAANRLDRQHLRDEHYSAIRGRWAENVPALPPRLAVIGSWIAKVSDQPASVWWAASQLGLHPDIKQQILWQLERSKRDIQPLIIKAWRYLFEAWQEKRSDVHFEWYDLKAAISKGGWDSAAIRAYATINRPYFQVGPAFGASQKPPELNEVNRFQDLMQLDVGCPDLDEEPNIPDDWLPLAVRELRKNLEHALQLETEIGGYGLRNISPIIPDSVPGGDSYGRRHGLSGSVISFSALFKRLINVDIKAARQEIDAWPKNDDTIFSRLKIWVSGKKEVVPARAFGPIIIGLSDDAFWDGYHQRDLLIVLAKRWKELPEKTRIKIENRLLKGRNKWDRESEAEYQDHRAWVTLSRIHWLAGKGCKFTFNLEDETRKLQTLTDKWKPEYSKTAADSRESRGGWVRTQTECSALLHEPLDEILAKALELSGEKENFLVRYDPFLGLSTERPVRAFSALAYEAKKGEYPAWAWRTFLNADKRKSDKPKFTALIAERISRYPDSAVAQFIHPASNWLLNVSQALSSNFPQSYDSIISKLTKVLRFQPISGNSNIINGKEEPDWATEALNAPAGNIAQALFNDSRISNVKPGEGFPAEWFVLIDNVLSLPGDLRRHALVIFAYHLDRLYTMEPVWTENNLLSLLEKGDESDKSALWSGFFWRAFVPSQKLYLRLKTYLLALSKRRSFRKSGYASVLAGIILAGWGSINEETGKRYISNAEMHSVLLRSDDQFRVDVIGHIDQWARASKNGAENKWPAMLIELFRDVWPRQLSAKTPELSARMCNLAFSDTERFPIIADIILPLLTAIDRDYITLPNLRKAKDTIVDLYPHQVLDLLHTVLPDNVSAWPYIIGDFLDRIGEADENLRKDDRLLELKRKWRSR